MADWQKATVVERVDWTDELISLRFQAALQPFQAGQFLRVALDIQGERVARPYSLVNPPHRNTHEIYFNIVPEGPLSPHLAQCQVGDDLWVTPKASGFLTLEEIPDAHSLWMLCTGTAIGPFLSILETPAPWSRFAHIILGHSVRHARELSYQARIEEIKGRHPMQFHYLPTVTRETSPGCLTQRIPKSIETGELEAQCGVSLAPENAHVMLCGNADMLNDSLQCLEKRGMKRHRRREPGHVSMEKYH